jgi:hypothetical protein
MSCLTALQKDKVMSNTNNQTELPLGDPETVLGLTPWFCALENPPVREGWYKTRVKESPKLNQPQRRYWNGVFFTKPALPTMSETEVDLQSWRYPFYAPHELEWCGLLRPHPGAGNA